MIFLDARKSCIINMILKVYILKDMTIVYGQKIKKIQLIRKLYLSDMPQLKVDEEEVREGKGLKILTPNKLLTRIPVLLGQIKTGNNSYKLKNKIKQYCIFCIRIIKSQKKFKRI